MRIRHTALVAAVGLTATATIVGCSASTTQQSSSTSPSASVVATPTATVTAGAKRVVVSLNEAAQLGELSYLVSSVKDLGKSLDSPEGGSITNGAFISATVRAQNSSAQPYRLDPGNFTATTTGGDTVKADVNDSIVANGNDPSFNRPIATGEVVVGQVVFNFALPPRGDVKTITIRDGSGGTVIVNV
jgi:hypothetical protein